MIEDQLNHLPSKKDVSCCQILGETSFLGLNLLRVGLVELNSLLGLKLIGDNGSMQGIN